MHLHRFKFSRKLIRIFSPLKLWRRKMRRHSIFFLLFFFCWKSFPIALEAEVKNLSFSTLSSGFFFFFFISFAPIFCKKVVTLKTTASTGDEWLIGNSLIDLPVYLSAFLSPFTRFCLLWSSFPPPPPPPSQTPSQSISTWM